MVTMTGASPNRVQLVKERIIQSVPDHVKIDSATAKINQLIEMDLPKTP